MSKLDRAGRDHPLLAFAELSSPSFRTDMDPRGKNQLPFDTARSERLAIVDRDRTPSYKRPWKEHRKRSVAKSISKSGLLEGPACVSALVSGLKVEEYAENREQ